MRADTADDSAGNGAAVRRQPAGRRADPALRRAEAFRRRPHARRADAPTCYAVTVRRRPHAAWASVLVGAAAAVVGMRAWRARHPEMAAALVAAEPAARAIRPVAEAFS